MHMHMYAWMHGCMYVCIHVCMYAYVEKIYIVSHTQKPYVLP